LSKTVLKIENLSKQYRLGLVGTGTLSHDLNRWWHSFRGKEDPYLKIGEANNRATKGDSDYVWALKDINFEVKQGEVLGVIGKNGAGKSTLLKILSKVTGPTTGSIKAKGRIASLLEVGTGFHPELTGRENIFLNGAILGMSRSEIQVKLDEIVAFAGVERYLDTPVKRYSSGMYVRLAFAIAAHLEPEILIVDEVLAVGDAEFQKKAIGKMQDVSKGEGRTVLFVSHNMNSIRSLCNKCILLENGKKVLEGSSDYIIQSYLTSNLSREKKKTEINYPDFKDRLMQIKSAKCIFSIKGIHQFEYSQEIEIHVDIIKYDVSAGGYLGMIILNENGSWVTVSATDDWDKVNLSSLKSGMHTISIKIPAYILGPGNYFLTFSLRPKANKPYHKVENCLSFEVVDTITFRGQKNNFRKAAIVQPKIIWRNV